ALPPGLAREAEQRMANATEASREFTTVREPRRPPPGELPDRAGPALMAVVGRTPAHLRLEVYDLFDGHDWWPDRAAVRRAALEPVDAGGQTWLRVPRLAGLELIRGRDLHSLRINRLDTNRVPTPWHPLGVRIDRVDRPDFFEWSHDTVLAMTRETLPHGLVLHWQSQPLHLPAWTVTSSVIPVAGEAYRGVGSDAGSQEIARLAHAWTAGLPVGEPQFAALVRHLREEYRLERNQGVALRSGHSVADFLLRERAGPDYQFAGAAVLLLRSLGYSARLVSGFYVRPERYDAQRRQTPVLPEDVHFWPEVYVGANTWIELEPTPGYELLAAKPTWFEWLARGVRRGWEVVNRHPVATLAGLGGLLGLWWWRRTLLDLLGVTVWWAWRARDPRGRVLQTLGLLNRRRRWFGPPAVAGSTLRRRLRPPRGGEPGTERVVEEFLSWADWAEYGGRVAPPAEPGSVEALCRRVQAVLGRGSWTAPRQQAQQKTGV
ncbi:MAG: transglutaminase-like domain-containing protein, partial [Planctomycetaceae bacterium]